MSDWDLACIISPAQGPAVPAGARWAADNGCGPKADGSPGDGYPGDTAYYAFLQHATGRVLERAYQASAEDTTCYGGIETRCLFAAAPDIPYEAARTLARAERPVRLLYAIRDGIGVPAALVAQDGMRPGDLPWDDFQVLFIGGSTAWKLSADARDLIREAKRRDLWVHMGRVNTRQRLRYAWAEGCDSCDGTTLARGPDKNTASMLRWLEETARQPALW